MKISRQQFSERPDVFVRNSTNEYTYNYDIKEELVADANELHQDDAEPTMKTVYTCMPIVLKGFPNKSQCIAAVMQAYISQSDELRLVNDMKAVDYGIIDGDAATNAINRYKEYLATRAAIKEAVKNDFVSQF